MAEQTSRATSPGGYWYGAGRPGTATAADLLHELRRYQESNSRMRSQLRDDMGMGEKDLLALRLLLAADADGRRIRQRDLAERLSISGASVSALVDRLVRDGYVERTPHPTDRRSTTVVPTALAHRRVQQRLRAMHARMMAVAEDMTAPERAVVIDFLRRLHHSLDALGTPGDADEQ